MAYKVVITKEIDEALDRIDEYCIEHFHNYEFAVKVFDEIMKVASFLSENAGKTKKYSKFLYKYVSPDIGYKFVAKKPHACVWDESHISLDIYLENNI